VNQYQTIVADIKKKPYDFLDQRQTDFDSGFTDFKQQIEELHVRFSCCYTMDSSHKNTGQLGGVRGNVRTSSIARR